MAEKFSGYVFGVCFRDKLLRHFKTAESKSLPLERVIGNRPCVIQENRLIRLGIYGQKTDLSAISESSRNDPLRRADEPDRFVRTNRTVKEQTKQILSISTCQSTINCHYHTIFKANNIIRNKSPSLVRGFPHVRSRPTPTWFICFFESYCAAKSFIVFIVVVFCGFRICVGPDLCVPTGVRNCRFPSSAPLDS